MRTGHLSLAVLAVCLSACGGSDNDSQEKPKTSSYTVTSSASTGGSITPASQSITAGKAAELKVTPDEGYKITQVTGCNGSLENTTYTTAPVDANCQVSASFSPIEYTVNVSKTGMGEIEFETQQVDHGDILSLALTPAEGYLTGEVSGCDGALENNTYTTTAVTQDCQIEVAFYQQQQGFGNASLGVNLEINVEGGFSVSPQSKGVSYPGQDSDIPALTGQAFPFGVLDIELAGPTGATASMKIEYEDPLPESFAYYKFGPKARGAEAEWYALPSEYYQISADRKTLTLTLTDGALGDDDWEQNGIIKDPGGPAEVGFLVTTQVTEGGTVSPQMFPASLNQTLEIVIQPDPGFAIEKVEGCPGVLTGNTYFTDAIVEDCEVSVRFIAQAEKLIFNQSKFNQSILD